MSLFVTNILKCRYLLRELIDVTVTNLYYPLVYSVSKDGTWRIKSNEELNRLTGNKNIINYIKAQRLAWFGHVHGMPDNSMVKKKKYMSGHPH